MPPVAKQQNPEDVRRAFVDLAFDEAYKIREELYGDGSDDSPGIFARRKANRDQLRQLAAQGMLDGEQRAELAELYAPRAVKSDDAEAEAETDAAAEQEAA